MLSVTHVLVTLVSGRLIRNEVLTDVNLSDSAGPSDHVGTSVLGHSVYPDHFGGAAPVHMSRDSANGVVEQKAADTAKEKAADAAKEKADAAKKAADKKTAEVAKETATDAAKKAAEEKAAEVAKEELDKQSPDTGATGHGVDTIMDDYD